MYLIISSKELICRIYKRPTQLYSRKKRKKEKNASKKWAEHANRYFSEEDIHIDGQQANEKHEK